MTRILPADDHFKVRATLAIKSAAGLGGLPEAPNVGVAMTAAHKPDTLAVLDLSMPELNGLKRPGKYGPGLLKLWSPPHHAQC
jgi:hypothetical protein